MALQNDETAGTRPARDATWVEDPAKFAPGTFGCHEAMCMALMLAEQVEKVLCDHPAVVLNPVWYDLAWTARETLGDLYNVIGRRHIDPEEPPADEPVPPA